MVRVDAALSNNTDPVNAAGSVMVSAYVDPTAKTVVIVLVNTLTTSSTLSLSGLTLTGSNFTAYTTSAGKNLLKSTMAAGNIQLEPRSVTTLMANYQ
jgi:hypothetical protein